MMACTGDCSSSIEVPEGPLGNLSIPELSCARKYTSKWSPEPISAPRF
jgi:hypothetical protein